MLLNPSNSLLLAAAAAWAAAELILGFTLGGFMAAGRAEFVAFFAVRPLLLIAASALASPWRWPRRWAFYAVALLAISLGETLLVRAVGNPAPWTELVRGFGASLLVLAAADLFVQSARRRRRLAGWIAAAALALALMIPAVRSGWDAVAMGPGDGRPAGHKPRLLLMTSLPIVWGEYGAFDPRSRPSRTYEALREEFDVQPIDSLDTKSLGSDKLMLLAQPRWLSPSELVALDDWVRRGGRAVVLADPDLKWPSDLPLGDVRRPLQSSLLGPLLAHWGLTLEPAHRPLQVTFYPSNRQERKYVLESPGSFSGPVHARRTIGAGRVILLADADLMRDDLWVAPGWEGDARSRRLADNPLYLADLLDEAAGISRRRVRAPVSWGATGGLPLISGLQMASLPTLILLALAILLALLGRNRPHLYPQARQG
ncbi:MAG TPA: Gldg family protein [Allosphingosinicella sp.]